MLHWYSQITKISKYFTTTKQLTRQQVQWSKYLSRFNYLIQFLLIALRPWDSISMDCIEGLPLSDGYDTILVIDLAMRFFFFNFYIILLTCGLSL